MLVPGGRLISTAERPDPVKADLQGIQAAFVTPAADPFQLAELAKLVIEHRLKPLIGQTFPLTEEGLRSAHRLSEGRQIHGKILIEIR